MTSRPLAFVPPALPTLVTRSPSGDEWMHEIKHDGYRAIAVVEDGSLRVFTRRGADYTDRMPGVVEALDRRHAPGAQLVAFDLLHLDGEDLRDLPIEERRAQLAETRRRRARLPGNLDYMFA
jgi:bifunctional non-homologous end joining protein LigD